MNFIDSSDKSILISMRDNEVLGAHISIRQKDVRVSVRGGAVECSLVIGNYLNGDNKVIPTLRNIRDMIDDAIEKYHGYLEMQWQEESAMRAGEKSENDNV